MKKKLLAGILALALCSTNMPIQTIFAGEFTSGNPDVVSEKETLEIFTNEEQEAAGETDEELSVFSSEELPEFNDAPDEAMAAAENARIKEIDLINSNEVINGVYTISSAGDYKFTCSNQETANRIVVDRDTILKQDNINIYLDNVNIKTSAVPALQIQSNVKAQVSIYLKGNNNLNSEWKAALQKDNAAKLTIDNSPNTTGELIATSKFGAGIGGDNNGGTGSNITIRGGSVTATSGFGAGIGGGSNGGTGSNITISGGSVKATSDSGAGIGGGSNGGTGSNITISGGSVTATSDSGAGIGGGNNGGTGSNITISGGSVKATSDSGAGIGGGQRSTGSNITISGGSVTATSDSGAGIGGGQGSTGSNITISGGSVKAYSDRMPGINCTPHNGNSTNVYCCIIKNEYFLPVTIDSESWKPSYHIFPDSTKDGNLYVWLTEKENNDAYDVTVGTEKRQYSFDQAKNQFVRIQTTPTADQFDYTQPNFTYTKDTHVDISKYIKWKDDVTGHGKITKVTYFKKGDKTPLADSPTDAGTYTFKIDVNEGDYYNSVDSISAPEWEFVISKAQAPSSKPTDTDPTIYVSWLCKKVEDVKGLFNDEWKWSDSDISKKLPVGEEVSATAVYNGTDADNYVNTSVVFKITRKACTHPHTAERYYSSPSCTSSGYSGDTYCTDCNETLSYGYTISAYGHDYDNGVITTEPTTETDGIITYTCKRCKHQDTKNLGKLGDGEPYIEGSFQKKSWDTVNDLIKTSKEKDTISIIMNGARTLPASVLSGIKGKDISLNLDMENGFIWKINGTSITAETPADIDLSVTNTAEHIPAALYSLISTNQNDFGFHLGRSGAFDFPAVLSVKADVSCAGLMANLFWYDVENGVLQCIQSVTVGGAFERSIPYAEFILSKGQDYFIAFGTESLNGRVIHTDGSITDENGAYLRPADAKISNHSIDRNKLTVKLSKGCAGAQGYDFVISKKSNMLQTGKFSKKVSSTGKPQASFRYLAKGTWYVAARSWVLDEQGNKVYGSWTKIKKIKITVVTPQQPKIKNITVKGNTVTVTYTKCKNATGYEILLGNKYKTSAGEKYPVKKYLKRTEGKNTVTVTFTNVKKGTWYVTIRAWNQTSKDKSRVYSPYSTMKKFKTKK
ncbi:carbohydrate-binding domain-containing protein [Blautia wexlerae]|uniref:carbohydrate-binding domain-containing protein n=1 Tax=Blautia wexlerae TaxID=418240 RepID=UPI0034A2BE6E